MSISLQRQTIKVCLANASALFSNSYIYFFLFHKVRNEYRETKLFFKLAKKKKACGGIKSKRNESAFFNDRMFFSCLSMFMFSKNI